jgi:predicted metal-dependent RNase
MDNKQGLTYSEIRQAILDKIPAQVGITRIEFEGPRLAIYCQKPEFLQENSHIVGEIAGIIKKRIVIRSDPSVRMGEIQAEDIIKEILVDAGLVQAYFDPALGEVVLEVEKPGVAIGKGGANVVEIVKKTHWSPNFKRSPPIPSMTIRQIRGFLYSKSKDREKMLRETGESIFRPIYQQSSDVRVTFLGSARQVGRSAILIKTRESEILMDCGINPGSRNAIGSFPRLDVEEFDLTCTSTAITGPSTVASPPQVS